MQNVRRPPFLDDRRKRKRKRIIQQRAHKGCSSAGKKLSPRDLTSLFEPQQYFAGESRMPSAAPGQQGRPRAPTKWTLLPRTLQRGISPYTKANYD